MPAIIVGALVLLIGGVILSTQLRNSIFNALAGVGNYVVGAWPTWAQFQQATRPLWTTLLILSVLAIASWFLFFAVMLGVGIAINAPWSGALIGLFFPAWCMLYIMQPFLGRLTRIPYVIATIILLLAIPMFVLGAWSPDVKGEFGRWTGNKKGELANFFGKSSVQSEPEAGIVGFASEDGVVVYNIKDRQTPVKRLGSGDAVMIVNLKGKPVDEDSEGMVPVKLANEYGDFKGKLRGWVVSRKISWSKPRKPEVSPPPPPPPPQVQPAVLPPPPPPPPVPKKRAPFWEVTIFDTGTNRNAKPIHMAADVEFPENRNRIIIKLRSGGDSIFEGIRVRSKGSVEEVYEGIWHSKNDVLRSGKFLICFESKTIATGWSSTQSGEKFPTRLERLIPE